MAELLEAYQGQVQLSMMQKKHQQLYDIIFFKIEHKKILK